MIDQNPTPAPQPNPDPKGPILIRASLRYHSPQQIYDYLYNKIGELGIKIKKKQAIIGFENHEYYEQLLKEHNPVMLHGKKLRFYALARADENYLESEEEVEIVEAREMGGSDGDANAGYKCPQFTCKSVIQAKVNRCRYEMHDKVQEMFKSTIQVTRERTKQLALQFRQRGPQQRQIFSLQSALQKKLKQSQKKFEQQVKKVNGFIHSFSTKPNNIDLQPTFAFEQNYQFPKITQKNMQFQLAGFYLNTEFYPCKRLCAINGEQFAVTMYHKKRTQGRIRLYNINNTDPKKSINMQQGCYGICRVNNFLIVGAYDQKLKYINLQDQQHEIDSSITLSEKLGATFFDIKTIKHSTDSPEIITFCGDYVIRKYQLSFEEMCPGLFSIFFTQKESLAVDESCTTFEVINPSVIAYGKDRFIAKYQLERKLTKQIKVSSKPLKIKKFNHNLIAVASQKVVQLVDQRTQSVVQTFQYMPKQMRSLQVLGQHSLMYGGLAEIGLLDDRRHEVVPWKGVDQHRGVVYDILRLRDRVVTGDDAGVLHSWKLRGEGGGMVGSVEPIVVQL